LWRFVAVHASGASGDAERSPGRLWGVALGAAQVSHVDQDLLHQVPAQSRLPGKRADAQRGPKWNGGEAFANQRTRLVSRAARTTRARRIGGDGLEPTESEAVTPQPNRRLADRQDL
jgi:hypothetical protein